MVVCKKNIRGGFCYSSIFDVYQIVEVNINGKSKKVEMLTKTIYTPHGLYNNLDAYKGELSHNYNGKRKGFSLIGNKK